MSRASSTISSSNSSSPVNSVSHDCLFCCAFNAFLQQHTCYHKLLTNNNGSSSANAGAAMTSSATALMEFQRHESRQQSKIQQRQRKTPSPTPSQKWFIQSDVTRDEIAKMLSDRPVGAFIVRPSKTCGVGSFVLSVRVPVFVNGNGIAHYLIIRTASNRYKFQGINEKEWSDIESLIVHHTIMREFLPCTLQMPQNDSNDCGCEDAENDAPPVVPPRHDLKHDSTSTLRSAASSWSASSRNSRSVSAPRSRANDHEVLSEFLQTIRSASPARAIPTRSSSFRPTVCC